MHVASLCMVPSPHGSPGISGTCCAPGCAPDRILSLCVPAPGRKRQHHPVARQPGPAPSCLWPHWTQPPSREALGCRAGAGRARPVLTLQQGSGPKSLAHQVLCPEPRAVDSFPLHPSAFWPEPLGPHPGAATPKVQSSSGPSHNFVELRDIQGLGLGLGPRW
uniref:Uncharacterized protein n=1 Tax=Cercocebus atys TaxID=9531 RepID=A0A2K5P368_CERAT